jgi:cell division protein FtsQ
VARKFSSTVVQEELYPLPRDASEYDAPGRETFDDSRLMELEAEQESPFLRAQKRVSVRRGSLPKKTANGLKWAALGIVVLAVFAFAGSALYRYGKHSWRFRIDSSDQIEVSGGQHIPRAQIMDVMGGDIGRNIFFVPLAQRRRQLEQIPWVESASVMRFVPNRLRIEIHERTPVAFARIGSHISLIDAGGNLMELSPGPKHKYSFPVISGMNASEPLSTRAARMKNYNALMQQLDSSGARYSQDISEVDLTDAEDVKVMTADPNGGVLVHLGSSNYLQRYKVYVTHVEAWRQQFQKLDSVDLRYDGQIIVNPDLQGIARQPTLTPAAAKAALAAGVKNAAIVNYEKYVSHPAPLAPANKQAPRKLKAGLKAGSKVSSKASSKGVAHHAASKPKAKTMAARNSAASHPLAPPKPNDAPNKTASAKPTPESANTKLTAAAPATAPTASTLSSPSQKKPAPTQTIQTTTPKPLPPVSARPLASTGSQKKPSPAIPKETPQN